MFSNAWNKMKDLFHPWFFLTGCISKFREIHTISQEQKVVENSFWFQNISSPKIKRYLDFWLFRIITYGSKIQKSEKGKIACHMGRYQTFVANELRFGAYICRNYPSMPSLNFLSELVAGRKISNSLRAYRIFKKFHFSSQL